MARRSAEKGSLEGEGDSLGARGALERIVLIDNEEDNGLLRTVSGAGDIDNTMQEGEIC